MANEIIKVYDAIPERWTQIELFHTTAKLLPELEKPTIVRHKGSDPTAGSVWISTLQHGNESTGLHVFTDVWKRFSKEDVKFPHDVYFFVANGYAALAGDSHWSYRFGPFQVDNNRCWLRESEQELTDKLQIPALQRQQIKEVSDIIEQSNPRYLLDVHDTTGVNKALGFTLRDGKDQENDVLYTMVDDVIFLQRLPGAFIDRFSEKYVAFGVECGKTGTAQAFEQGKRMVWSFINLQKTQDQPTNAYKNLKRIVIKPDVDFDFINLEDTHGGFPTNYDGSFLIRDDLERMNQEDLLSFTHGVPGSELMDYRTLDGVIGYYPATPPTFSRRMPFTVLENDNDVTDKYFTTDGIYVYAKEHCYGQLFSTNKQNVRDSELGYISEKLPETNEQYLGRIREMGFQL